MEAPVGRVWMPELEMGVEGRFIGELVEGISISQC
jgi:hypothetical protein